jgi:hypothetical protein
VIIIYNVKLLGNKKRDNSVRPTNESRSVIPFYFVRGMYLSD